MLSRQFGPNGKKTERRSEKPLLALGPLVVLGGVVGGGFLDGSGSPSRVAAVVARRAFGFVQDNRFIFVFDGACLNGGQKGGSFSKKLLVRLLHYLKGRLVLRLRRNGARGLEIAREAGGIAREPGLANPVKLPEVIVELVFFKSRQEGRASGIVQ